MKIFIFVYIYFRILNETAQATSRAIAAHERSLDVHVERGKAKPKFRLHMKLHVEPLV